MNKKDISINKIRFVFGLFLFLFGIFCLLNTGYLSQIFVLGFCFLFGYVGYFVLFPAFILIGLHLLINNKKIKIKNNLLMIGICVFLLSLLIFCSVFAYFPINESGDSLEPSTFNDLYIKSYLDAIKVRSTINGFYKFNPVNKLTGGGYFGFIFAGLLNVLTPIFTIVTTSCLMLFAVSLIVIILLNKERKKNNKSPILDFEEDVKEEDNQNLSIDLGHLNFNPNESKNSSLHDYSKDDVNKSIINYEISNDSPINEVNTIEETKITNEVKENIIEVESVPEIKVEEKKDIFEDLNKNYSYDEIEPKKVEKKGFVELLDYVLPSIDLLQEKSVDGLLDQNNESVKNYQECINETLKRYNVDASAVSYTIGPRVTRFDILMGEHTSVNEIPPYLNDISSRLGGIDVRFEKIVTGKMTSGLEVPNKVAIPVYLKEFVTAINKEKDKPLMIPFGKDIEGNIKYSDLAKFPHLLVAGYTGSGKTVFVHSILCTLLLRNKPDDLKLILVDPKRVEFTMYKNIGHLLCPIIIEPKEANLALEKLVEEMNRRYDMMSECMVNHIVDYNKKAKINNLEKMPFIVCVIDEFADLIQLNKKVELSVNLLAAKARSAGIHLLIATQRPSVEIIPGTIKNNLPVRVALKVADMESSRTILNGGGAEKLLTNGDMLARCPFLQSNGDLRLQSPFISNEEILAITDYIRANSKPEYNEHFINLKQEANRETNDDCDFKDDDLLKRAIVLIKDKEYISQAKLVSCFGIGYPKAGKLLNKLISLGLISDEVTPAKGNKVIKH